MIPGGAGPNRFFRSRFPTRQRTAGIDLRMMDFGARSGHSATMLMQRALCSATSGGASRVSYTSGRAADERLHAFCRAPIGGDGMGQMWGPHSR